MSKQDTIETMGKILPDDFPVGTRDAVHVAVIAATAGQTLWAGEDVCYENGIGNTVANTEGGKNIGIVDPYLERKVSPGQKFWLFLYPRTITTLKHHWEHPDFKEETAPVGKKVHTEADVTAAREKAEEYLHQWAGNHGVEYTSMLSTFKDSIDGNGELDDCINLGTGSTAYVDNPYEFWSNVELVLNVNIVDKKKVSYFVCGC